MNSKIGILGHFAVGKSFYDGQTIKTKILYKELNNRLGRKVEFVDIFGWKKNFIKILYKTINMSKNCDYLIIVLSKKGRNIFIPILYVCKVLFGTKVHCIVLGGGFAHQMKKHKIVRYFSKKIDGIYVETQIMLSALSEMSYQNIHLLNNFKTLDIVNVNSIDKQIPTPLRLCTFSRVCKEKGIEDIVNSVININQEMKKTIYTLDIYGQIKDEYKVEFQRIIQDAPEYIQYKGIIDFDKSVDTIKKYFMLAFPTLYRTEGVPGTIIDAYAAGVPVIASEWESCEDVVENNVTGFTYELANNEALKKLLLDISINPDKVINLKINCIKRASDYSSENVILKFLDILNLKKGEIN